MNNSNKEIKKLNAHYLKSTTEKIYKSNANIPAEPNEEVNKSLSLPKIPVRNTEQEHKLKVKKSSVNLKYVNDSYRKQLNQAFMNFNPAIHLGNLNLLRKADPEINADIEKLTKQIEESLKEITSKEYYKNNYLKIKEENDKRKERLHTQIETTGPTLPTEGQISTFTLRTNYKPPLKKQMNYKSKAEQRKKFPYKEQKENESNIEPFI